MTKKDIKPKFLKETLIAGLVVNLLLPGLGTIILGIYDIGSIQLILSIIGLFFLITLIGSIIGIPLFIAMWIWSLITGMNHWKKLKRQKLI